MLIVDLASKKILDAWQIPCKSHFSKKSEYFNEKSMKFAEKFKEILKNYNRILEVAIRVEDGKPRVLVACNQHSKKQVDILMHDNVNEDCRRKIVYYSNATKNSILIKFSKDCDQIMFSSTSEKYLMKTKFERIDDPKQVNIYKLP